MRFRQFVLKRSFEYVISLFGLSILIFFIVRILPGDPVRAAIGVTASEEAVQRTREEMYLDENIFTQYFYFMRDISQGSLGQSLRTGRDVTHDLSIVVPATFELAFVGLLFALMFGIPLGIIAGTYRDKWPDHGSRILALGGISFPRFWLAILLQVIFVGWLSLFPLTGRLSVDPPPHFTGMYLIDSLIYMEMDVFRNAIWHLILPAIALGLPTLAQITRLVRSEYMDIENKDYVINARANGIPELVITLKYKLKNAFTSSLTVLGIAFGGMLSGSFFVELIFHINGLGRYSVVALLQYDLNAIVGVTLVIGVIYLTVNSMVDILYGYLNPKIRR